MKRKRKVASHEFAGRGPVVPAEGSDTAYVGGGRGQASGAEADLDAAYALMALDGERERRALEWSEALIGDVGPLRP